MRFLIKDYINKIDVLDIIKFAKNENINVNEGEARILLFYLKNNWEELLYGSPLPIINDIESKLGKSKGKIIVDLFFKYKEKYKDYL